MATINHPTYSCDKCGKVFEKRINVRHSWPKILPYAMDRANYCDVRFTLDIWHGGSTPDPDLCPDCIREILLGALEDLDGQTPKEVYGGNLEKDGMIIGHSETNIECSNMYDRVWRCFEEKKERSWRGSTRMEFDDQSDSLQSHHGVSERFCKCLALHTMNYLSNAERKHPEAQALKKYIEGKA